MKMERSHIVIYGESATYWSTFEPLLRELGRRDEKVEYLTSTENDPCFSAGLPTCIACKYIGSGTKAYTRLNFMKADVMVLTTPGIDVLQIRRSSGVGKYIHVLHSLVDLHKYKLFSFDYYDAVICNGEYQVKSLRALEAARGTQPKDLPIAGCLYFDGLVKRHEQAPSVQPDPVCVLLAPTWGNLGMLSRYGTDIPRILADAGFNVIIRPHPQSFISDAQLIRHIAADLSSYKNIVWDKNPDGYHSLSRASILISDFSGVIFAFAFLFFRPVITLYDRAKEREGFEAFDLDHPNWNIEVIKEIGSVVSTLDLQNLPAITQQLLSKQNIAERIREIRNSNIANFGCAAGPVAEMIIKMAETQAK